MTFYDALTRLTGKSYAVTGSGTLKTTYKYHDWASNANHTTGTVEGIDYTFATGGLTVYDRWYGYDAAGNIVSESMRSSDGTNTLRQKYTYDSKNQLIRHDSATKKRTTEYVYDAAGNITAKKTYAYTLGDLTGLTPTETITYGYSEGSWHDLLTSYNGQAITYDAIGNPITYRGWTMSWQGRQLESAAKDGNSLSFTYDSDGIRTSKTVGNVKTSYLLNGTQILAQTTSGKTLCFFYDQQGNRVAMADSSNHIYYYLYNLQGDVIALADGQTGKLAATYTYDALGEIVKINGQNPEDVASTNIANINPFRYRGYYYDTETGLYYLQSRYYDPDTGRFISADAFTSTDISGALSTNMFAYCENNPVMRSDPTGEVFTEILGGAILGGAYNVLTTCFFAAIMGDEITPGMLAGAFMSGAVSGALTFTAVGKVASVAINAAASVAGYVTQQAIDGERVTVTGLVQATATGVVSGIASGEGIYAKKEVTDAAKECDALVYNFKTKTDANKYFESTKKYQETAGSALKKSIKGSAFYGFVVNGANSLFSKAKKWLFG